MLWGEEGRKRGRISEREGREGRGEREKKKEKPEVVGMRKKETLGLHTTYRQPPILDRSESIGTWPA
jgi:hypothetical protein